MFRKDFKIKTNVKSKNSEKRKLITEISNFYHIDTLLLNNCFGKSDLHKVKVECYDGSIITIFNFDDQPLFFELNKIIVPSLYCLWTLYEMLPSFTIYEETVAYITNGSDLMIPGIIVKKPLNEKCYGDFKKGEFYAIDTNTNRAPIAVGLTNMDNYDMFMTGGKGKALNVLHVQGDYLWLFGKRNLRPHIDYTQENSIKNDEISANDNNNEILITDITEVKEDLMDMNELLEKCFLHAIKCSLKDKTLPITLNMFYANHVLKFCPEGVILDVKKTSFKKFGIFIKTMEDAGLLKLKFVNKGVEAIETIDRSHEKLKFTPSLTFQEERQSSKSDGEYVFPVIEEVFFVTDKLYNILRFYNFRKSDVIYPKEIKTIITEYVNKNNLNGLNKDMVMLDGVLKSCCLTSKEVIDSLSWKTLFERINKNMTPGIILKFPNESITIKNSKKPKIRIQSFNRHNKMVTRIEGEDQFGIDSKKLSFQIQQSIGCSCGLVTDKSGITAIQAQGDQVARVIDILTGHFKVPLNFIDGLVNKKTK